MLESVGRGRAVAERVGTLPGRGGGRFRKRCTAAVTPTIGAALAALIVAAAPSRPIADPGMPEEPIRAQPDGGKCGLVGSIPIVITGAFPIASMAIREGQPDFRTPHASAEPHRGGRQSNRRSDIRS